MTQVGHVRPRKDNLIELTMKKLRANVVWERSRAQEEDGHTTWWNADLGNQEAETISKGPY